MDCCVTLGVLCDQVVPVDESADEEEQLLRRSLVLSFISTEANRAIVDRHAKQPSSKVEEILAKALTAVRFLDTDSLSTLPPAHRFFQSWARKIWKSLFKAFLSHCRHTLIHALLGETTCCNFCSARPAPLCELIFDKKTLRHSRIHGFISTSRNSLLSTRTLLLPSIC
jgi:hypothetical protein